jgi:hypothetical protein
MQTSEIVTLGTSPGRPTQNRVQSSAEPAGASGKHTDLILSDDMVTLSKSSSAAVQKPSIPVTADEKNALLGQSDPQYGFSIYS